MLTLTLVFALFMIVVAYDLCMFNSSLKQVEQKLKEMVNDL